VPKITDFGLAKQLDGSEGRTRPGDLVGTPSYMAPEQASGHIREIGPHTDTYALGALLYEMLTGRPPFNAAHLLDTLEMVRSREPVPPRQLQPAVPRDLETICLKCLRKEPSKRYASAQALADDLTHFLEGKPIEARPVGKVERLVKWVRRQPALAALGALSIVAVVGLLALGFWFSARIGAEGERTQAAQRLAQTHEFFGLLRAIEKRSTQREAGWTWANQDDLASAVALVPAGERQLELRSELATALGSIDIRPCGVVGEGFDAACLAFHPDGRRLALGDLRACLFATLSIPLIDVQTQTTAATLTAAADFFGGIRQDKPDGVRSLAFSPDGRWLVAGTRHGALHRWDLNRQPPAHASWPGHQESVAFLAFSADGTALFSASDNEKIVHRWAVSTWEKPAANPKPDHSREVSASVGGLAVHPTEGWLLCGSRDGKFHFLSHDTLQALRPAYPEIGFRPRFSPDGNSLLYEGAGILHLLNLRREQVIRRLTVPGREIDRQEMIDDVAFSPDGFLLAATTAETKHLRLWGTANGRLLADLFVGGGPVKVAFSPNGRLLAVAGDHQTQLYQIGGLREQTFVAGQPQEILAAALHPDGRSLACLSDSLLEKDRRDVALWRLGEKTARTPAWHTGAEAPPNHVAAIACSPREQALACTTGGPLVFLDGPFRAEQCALPEVTYPALCYGPDGRLWGAVEDEVRVWDARGRPLLTWSNRLMGQLIGKAAIYAISAGQHWAVAGGRDGLVHLLHGTDARREAGAIVSQAPVRAVALNGAETVVAAGSEKGELCLVALPGCEELARVAGHGDRVQALSWSGNLLASGSRDQTVKLWRCDGGVMEEVLTLRQAAPVRWLAFHPDGVRLFVLLDGERAVRVWHLDLLRARLAELNLDRGLETVEARPLPAAAPQAPATPPVREEPDGPNGLKAELFEDMESNRCVKVRYDAQINVPWPSASLDRLLPSRQFSARWTGWLKAPHPGRYTLRLDSAGAGRLWLDDRLRMDFNQAAKFHDAEVELTDRPHALRVEYVYQDIGIGVRLAWAQAGGFALETVPPWALVHDRQTAERTPVPPARCWQAEEVPTPVSALADPLCVALTPDGSRLLIGLGDKTVRVTEFPGGKEIRCLQRDDGTGWCTALALSPDGKHLVMGSKDADLWDLASGKRIRTFRGQTNWRERLALSPDGRFLVTSGMPSDGTVRVWNVATGEEVRRLRRPAVGIFRAVWHPDGKRIVTCSSDDRSVRLWNAATGEQIAAQEKGIDRWESLAVTPDGRFVALAGRDQGTVEVLAVEQDALRRRWSLRLGCRSTEVAFSHDGRLLAVINGRTVQIRDTFSGALVGRVEEPMAPELRDVRFSPDGKYLVTVGNGPARKAGPVRVWKLTKCKASRRR
jgi:WD40 repeat protein